MPRILISYVLALLLSGHHPVYAGPADTTGLSRKIGALHAEILRNLPSQPGLSRRLIGQAFAVEGIRLNKALNLQIAVDLAAWYKYRGFADSAITLSYKNLGEAAALANDSLKLYCTSNLAISYFKKGLSDSALLYHQETLKLSERCGNRREKIRSLYFLGALYNSIGSAKRALSYFNLCSAEAKRFNDDFLIAYSCDGLASYYYETGSYNEALRYYQKALHLYKKLGNRESEARSYTNISSVYDELGEPGLSVKYAGLALQLFEKLGSRNEVLLIYINLTATYLNDGKTDEALKYATPAEQLATELRSLDNQERIYNYLSKLFQMKGDQKKALAYYQKQMAVKDSIQSLAKIKYIEELEQKYQSEKKELEIRNLLQQNKLKEAESALHKRRSYFWLTASLLLLAISGLTLFIFRQRARNARMLAEKNEQLYRRKISEIIKEQELKSINEIMEGQEHERKRIAEDLHDRLGSMLATIKLHFNAVEHKIDSLELKSLEQYQKANRLLDEVCDEVRKIAHNMESGVLVNFGLLHAITDLKEALEHSSSLKINVSSFGMKERPGTEIEITVYRVLQELLSNVIKHASATEVNIDLSRTSDMLTVILSDNGSGYESESVRQKGGMGLRNIQARLAKLGGNFYVDSGQKNGTTNIIEIPLKHDQYPHS